MPRWVLVVLGVVVVVAAAVTIVLVTRDDGPTAAGASSACRDRVAARIERKQAEADPRFRPHPRIVHVGDLYRVGGTAQVGRDEVSYSCTARWNGGWDVTVTVTEG